MGDRFDGGMDATAPPPFDGGGPLQRPFDAAALSDAGACANATVCSTAIDDLRQPCNPPAPAYRCGHARWIDARAHCGDRVRMEAVITGYPPDSPATIEVLHPANGSIVESINANLHGGRVDASWIAIAQTANWRTDRIPFRIRVPGIGITCTSSNSLTFVNRPTAPWERMNQQIAGLNGAAVNRIYDQALEPSRVHISVKVKLTGMSLQPAELLSIKRSIESTWNDGFSQHFRFHRAHCKCGATCNHVFDCCQLGFRLDFSFVDTGQHITVDMRDGTMFDNTGQLNQDRQEDTSRTGADPGFRDRTLYNLRGAIGSRSSREDDPGTIWYYPPWAAGRNGVITRDAMLMGSVTYAHEIGHILGNFDEYPGGSNDSQGYQPVDSTTPVSNQNLMSNFGITTMPARFYRYFLWFLNQHADSDPYVIVDPSANSNYVFP